MKAYIAGATGRVATELIADLVAAGHEVVAGARNPEKVAIPEKTSDGAAVTPVHFDVHGSVDNNAATLDGADVVYFVAGSRGKDLLQTDAYGAIKVMQAAEQRGIKRFIMLSSIYSLEPDEWLKESMAPLRNYITAKFFADHYLVHNTSLSYTILQPTNLTEEAGTGLIELGSTSGMTNPIPDVASVLAQLINHPGTVGKVIRMGSGSTPIPQALAAVE
jgi:nucleoside-diphosphate-sugar epimerase